MTNLERMNLNGCGLRNVSNGIFKGLASLKVLKRHSTSLYRVLGARLILQFNRIYRRRGLQRPKRTARTTFVGRERIEVSQHGPFSGAIQSHRTRLIRQSVGVR